MMLQGDWSSDVCSSDLYTTMMACPACKGSRLKDAARVVTICGEGIWEVTKKSIKESAHWFRNLALDKRDAEIAERLLRSEERRVGKENRSDWTSESGKK